MYTTFPAHSGLKGKVIESLRESSAMERSLSDSLLYVSEGGGEIVSRIYDFGPETRGQRAES
jgi:hypothetical protein